jgi:hypothetical protein
MTATADLPRVRGPQSTPADAYSDDMTQELPIFRELESRWFSDSPVTAAATATPGARAAAEDVSWRSSADDGWSAARAAAEPQDGGTTEMGLPRRVPMAQLVPGGSDAPTATVSERRTPDSVRGLLSAYTRGVQRGRGAYGRDDDPSSEFGGREQEA